MKTKPFMGRKTSIFYIVTVALVQPYWVLEIYANFTYFNNINDIFLKTRPFEALFRYTSISNSPNFFSKNTMLTSTRDPWWIYTTCCLLYNIRTRYNFGLFELMYISPRFAVMLLAMILSIIFTIIDICAVTDAFQSILPVGINPFWKLAFVFKLLTDSVILDDFKTALDKLSRYNLTRAEERSGGDWASSKNMTNSRHEPPVPNVTTVMGTRAASSESKDPWIAVTTETKVESYHMSEMGESSSRGSGQARA
jgi:hypothetical protein